MTQNPSHTPHHHNHHHDSSNSSNNRPSSASSSNLPQNHNSSNSSINIATPQPNSSNASQSAKDTKKPSMRAVRKAKKMKRAKQKNDSFSADYELDSKGIPVDFKDPISHLIMVDPVSTEAGSTYERESIERWLDTSDLDPITGMKLKTKLVFPNNALKNQITLFLERKPQYKEYLCAQGEYTLERLSNLAQDESKIHEVARIIRKSPPNLRTKESKQNILHILFNHACCVGHISKAMEQRVISDHSASLLNERDSKGHLPTTIGLQNPSYEVFKHIVNEYRDTIFKETRVNRFDSFSTEGQTYLVEHLMDSCSDGFLNGVKACIHFGTGTSTKTEYGEVYPIEEAAYYGHSTIVKYLWSKGNVPKEQLDLALGMAAEGHQIECVKVCIELGADISSCPEGQPSALTRAVGNLQTVKYLVENGAPVNVDGPSVGEEPGTPLSAAAQAIDGNNTEEVLRVMDYLLEKGANIDYMDDRGWAAIHYAARALNKKALGKLIENECNVDLRTNKDKTVYDIIDEFADEASYSEESYSSMDGEDASFIEEDIEESPSVGEEEVPIVEEEPEYHDLSHNTHPIYLGEEEGEGLDHEEGAEEMKLFIKEHSKLVKRLRQSMLKKDVSSIAQEVSSLKEQHANVFSTLKQHTEMLHRLLHAGGLPVPVHADNDDNETRKRKRSDKKANKEQPKKKKRVS